TVDQGHVKRRRSQSGVCDAAPEEVSRLRISDPHSPQARRRTAGHTCWLLVGPCHLPLLVSSRTSEAQSQVDALRLIASVLSTVILSAFLRHSERSEE